MINRLFKYSLVSFTSIISYKTIHYYYTPKPNNLSKLINAAQNGDLEIVKDLIEYTCVDREDIFNFALNLAAYNGHIDIVKCLVSVNYQFGNGGYSRYINTSSCNPLISASTNGHLDIVKYLVEKGANINDYNDKVIKLASEYKHLDIVNYLTNIKK